MGYICKTVKSPDYLQPNPTLIKQKKITKNVYCRATRTPGTATTLMVDWNQSIKKQQSTNGQQINSNLFRLGIRPRNCKYFIIVSAPSNLDFAHQQHRQHSPKTNGQMSRLHQPMVEIITKIKQSQYTHMQKQRLH